MSPKNLLRGTVKTATVDFVSGQLTNTKQKRPGIKLLIAAQYCDSYWLSDIFL